MITLDLNGVWKMKEESEVDWQDAIVPGSVMNDLLVNEKIDDPFYRDNEHQSYEIASKDYQYTREFHVEEQLYLQDKVLLVCEGLDTIAHIYINGKLITETENMHCTYEIDVKPFVEIGKNEITILLFSPISYIKEKQEQMPLWGVVDAVEGYPHIRKAHSMFGWDWGPKIPDLGIWRNIFLVGYSTGRIEDVYITQNHAEEVVVVDVRVKLENVKGSGIDIDVTLISPDGDSEIKTVTIQSENEEHISFSVENPHLWWPNGYGDQPLYKVEVNASTKDKQLDKKEYHIGLRTLTIKHEPDEWGKSFEFVVNGISIFGMGANYIPEDNILARVTPERTETLLRDCIAANFNMIRVWGGGYYPDDYFFDLCDRLGLIVWQDFMFGCSVYNLSDDFKQSITQEAIDNIKRIRHHASLGLWCGNNEVEEAWVYWDFPKTPKHRTDYIKIFEVLLDDIVKEYDPQTYYWPSSPSSGGGFDRPRDPNEGDVHYWEVWHGLKPFDEYRKYHFRFCSEFGFQSFPSLKTVKSFTLPEDQNIFSYVMEQHQKNGSANGKILFYLSENYLYPKDFDTLLYASQLLQADAIKYGVEHWRRNRGRCMGSIYWQLNDCWPVASWSSIDSYGRWKALHYFAKKFYAPVLLSINEEGTTAGIYITNETVSTKECRVEWKLRQNDSSIISSGTIEQNVAQLSAVLCETLVFDDILQEEKARETYLECVLYVDGVEKSSTTVLFTKPKHFAFLNPSIRHKVTESEESFIITLTSTAFAKYVELDVTDADCKFSDNYFDLSANEPKQITVDKSLISEKLTVEDFTSQLAVRSVFDIA
ncbi:beta-mannosidase [Bacillus alkalicellulosilyticus]|uniref:beta-mannosidase n=1 Tax=Alkalihalobacterium alkalicellulosilyticum TaxID=1912214 RepID=UPI000997872A|nr:glycoside hydrolase family 2 protein [Bacillus alkalicellulosilyticus]